MDLSSLPPDLSLCVQVLRYSIYSKDMQDLKCGEVRRRIEAVFGKKLAEESFQVLTGEHPPPNSPDKR
jgi:hypothetical protein